MPQGQPPVEEPDIYPYIDLKRARLCLDCEMIFDAPQCPACASESFVPVTRWIRPSEREISERTQPHPPSAANAAPPAKPSKRLLKKSLYVGLSAYGLWKMLFEPAKPRRRRQPPQPTELAQKPVAGGRTKAGSDSA